MPSKKHKFRFPFYAVTYRGSPSEPLESVKGFSDGREALLFCDEMDARLISSKYNGDSIAWLDDPFAAKWSVTVPAKLNALGENNIHFRNAVLLDEYCEKQDALREI